MLLSQLNFKENQNEIIKKLLNNKITENDENEEVINESILNLLNCLKNIDMINDLEKAVFNKDPMTQCVVVPKDTFVTVKSCDIKVPAHLLALRIWRWQDLDINNEIKPITGCKSNCADGDVCINPYHYQKTAFNLLNYLQQKFWCSISYYELNERVGEAFHAVSSVNEIVIDGYTNPTTANRFCLGALSNVNRKPEVELTRRHIGRGIKLYNEGDKIICECLSENSVFVQSPVCNLENDWHIATVCKLPHGCKFSIFNMNVFSNLLNETIDKTYEDTYNLSRLCAIRISFVKGWGAHYRRQTILNIPCWIEIHLNAPLKWIDSTLKLKSPNSGATSLS